MFLAKLSQPNCSLKLRGFDPDCQEVTLNQDNSTLLITDREFDNGMSEGHKGRREGRREEEREGASGRERERARDRGIKRMRNDREMRRKKEGICQARAIPSEPDSERGTASGEEEEVVEAKHCALKCSEVTSS